MNGVDVWHVIWRSNLSDIICVYIVIELKSQNDLWFAVHTLIADFYGWKIKSSTFTGFEVHFLFSQTINEHDLSQRKWVRLVDLLNLSWSLMCDEYRNRNGYDSTALQCCIDWHFSQSPALMNIWLTDSLQVNVCCILDVNKAFSIWISVIAMEFNIGEKKVYSGGKINYTFYSYRQYRIWAWEFDTIWKLMRDMYIFFVFPFGLAHLARFVVNYSN